VIAVSNATADDATRLRVVPQSRIRIIREAADPVFSPKPGASGRVKDKWRIDGRYLLFVGALDARKDPHALLDAWTAARVIHPDLKLLIAGVPGRQAPPSMAGAVLLGRVVDQELGDL
jgi:glycosyltransferase involved in cell wall biosynthesis